MREKNVYLLTSELICKGERLSVRTLSRAHAGTSTGFHARRHGGSFIDRKVAQFGILDVPIVCLGKSWPVNREAERS